MLGIGCFKRLLAQCWADQQMRKLRRQENVLLTLDRNWFTRFLVSFGSGAHNYEIAAICTKWRSTCTWWRESAYSAYVCVLSAWRLTSGTRHAQKPLFYQVKITEPLADGLFFFYKALSSYLRCGTWNSEPREQQQRPNGFKSFSVTPTVENPTFIWRSHMEYLPTL